MRSVAADGAVLSWLGAADAVFRDAIGDYPAGASALRVCAVDLDDAQGQADRALTQGRAARADLVAAQDSWGGDLDCVGCRERAALLQRRVTSAGQRSSSSYPLRGGFSQVNPDGEHPGGRSFEHHGPRVGHIEQRSARQRGNPH